MEIAIMELRESEQYCKFRDHLHNNHLLKSEISRRLGSEKQVQMIIYALGSLEYNYDAHYQLALALLLREEVDILRIGEIQVFDPVITSVDAAFIQSLGCTVLSVNEYARRKVEKPTLFFLPFAWHELVANLLETNWSPSKLDNLIILGSSMHGWAKSYDQPDYRILKKTEINRVKEEDQYRYMNTIKDFTVDFTVDKEYIQLPLNQFYWVFFNLQPEFDINPILPSKFLFTLFL
ncbi:SRR1-like domain-containing protein [Dioscorea alata]|uniref:SRR1-like domain-containing protein n=1 Tax=Dioscorea alata TaxID=55571 RepID=A0ACB7VWW6_DIOAL|nr:SRR1-like domain-containing protein [Dioscorea alata]